MPLRAMRSLFVLLSAVVLAGCPADGHRVNLCDNPDLSCDDVDACTMDSCDPVTGCVNQRISCDDRSACTVDSCSPASGCVNAAISCDDENQCTGDSCDASLGCMHTDIAANCADGDACTADSCNTVSGCVNDTISCDDSNQCTAESCDSVTGCANRPVADGTSCDGGLGQCAGGVCEASDCFQDGDCNDSDACTMDRCNLATNECVNEDISASCDDDNACTEDRCAPATGCVNTDIADRCEDGEECTADSCAPATGCRRVNVADGTPCDAGTGECGSGTCVPLSAVQYSQDLESLDRMSTSALAEDGWLVFGNVFDGEAYLYGYGPFPAPNSGEGFCAIVAGQGGGPQGTQQLSVYSDYKNTDHANGYLIESTVYRERAITAADVGKTISFSFDAKRGNINDPSDPLCPCRTTAVGFIKTLNPMAGFATTNFVKRDTTALMENWDRYEITLAIDAGLVGQLLQVGFANTTTLYQPSGNFYDNIEVRRGPTPQ